MNEKQQTFAEEYLIDLNATQAAIRAGYSQDTAYSYGQQLLKHIEVRAYIDKAMQERSEKTMIDACFVVESLKEVASRCMQATPVMKFNFASQKMEQVQDENGNPMWMFDSQGANKSLELLGKHLAIFTEKNINDNRGAVSEDVLKALVEKINA